MALTLDDLFASPDHYLHSFDGDAAVFVPMDRAAYGRSIFLDQRIAPAGSGSMRLPLAALGGRVPAAAGTGFIFHVAHCGSTLLARAIDRPETNLVLREPLALRQLAITPDPGRLALLRAMLGKRYAANLPTIVKANVPVNFLLPQLAAADPAMPAILLYCTLDDYLLAILRSDDHRAWLGRVTAQLAPRLGDLSGLADAERAAALWLAQMLAFADAIARLPHARSLDAEHFFADPAAVVRAVARHLGVPISAAEAATIVSGPLFATYSKNPSVRFDNADRLARRAALMPAIAAERTQAEAWIARHGDEADAALATIAHAALEG